MHIGFTGTQRGMARLQRACIAQTLFELTGDMRSVLLHGDCIGADAEMHRTALGMHLFVGIHPPINESKRAFCKDALYVAEPKPYLDRNRVIVQLSTVLFAASGDMTEQQRSGTWSTIRFARRCNKRIWIFFPDGSFKIEEPEKHARSSS